MRNEKQARASFEAPPSVLTETVEAVGRHHLNGYGELVSTIEQDATSRHVAVGSRAAVIEGTARELFSVPYRDQTLRFLSGAKVLADAGLHTFLVRNNCPVDWNAT